MLNNIIGFSIRNKLIIALFVLSLIGWGTYEVTKLPIDALPDITDNQVQVITVSPSLGAPDIERLITFPIEQACSSISGLKQIRSFSRFGLSLVTIVFDEETDVYWARQQIAERLQQVQQEIPQGIGSPVMAPVSTGLGEIYQYVVRPAKGYEGKYDDRELRTIQDWIVRRQLLGTTGVAEVSSFGGRLKQYEVAVRQEQLKAYGLTIAEIFDALEKNNENTGGAYIEKGPTVLYIRSEGLTTSLADIEKIVVKTLDNGMPVLMGQVAKVQFGSAIRYGAMTYNADGEVAGGVVMMLKGENSSDVVKRVKNKIAEIQKMVPEGVVVEPFLDRTKMVDNAISTVQTNLIEGALIVIFVLVFFLGNLRAGLIVSSVIPLSMLFAIILMNKFGVGGNLMSLGAIDFGLIVDGSVIVVEAILHRFSHSKHFRSIGRIDQTQMDGEVEKSTGSMIKSAVFSQIIILIVYLPILSLEGIEGKMFKPMAWTIAFAILGAFILSVTYVPMMSALCLNKTINHKKNITDKLMAWLERRYQPILSAVLKYPKAVLSVTISLFAISIFMMSSLGGEFIPQLEEGDFAVETRLLTGSNLNNTIETTQKASKILIDEFPEVIKIVTKIGSAEIPTDPMPFEAGDMMVILKPKKEWTSAKSFPELSAKMTKAVEVIPGITVGFQFPVQMRFNELMTGARQDVVCKIFGEDLDSLSVYAKRLGGIIGTVDGAINVYEEQVTGMPQVVIKYNREGMAKYGINVSDVNRVVNTAFAGQIAGQVYEGEKRFDMVVRLDEAARKNIRDVENLMVLTQSGNQIPLSLVASVEEVEGVNQIQRENTKRRIIVGFNVKDRDVQSIVEELQQKVGDKLDLSKGYTISYGGSFENMTAAKAKLSIVVPIALLLIFLLLYFAFGSVKQGLLIYTAIPLSATGGIFALWIRDLPFSISAGVGFIALFGVAVLNGILLVTEFNRLKKEGWVDVKRRVIHATKSKLRAVLMTALVPSLGFIPMAISTGAGGAVQKPLATVVIGGLLVSTLLTLFVLPILYILFEKGFSYFRLSAIKKQKLQMKNRLKVGAVCMAIFIAACGSPNKNEEATSARQAETINADEVQLSGEQVKNAGILSGKLEEKGMHSTILVNGIVEVPPENTYSVSVPMGGYIKKMMLIPGMLVKKGVVLATVEDQQYIQLQQDYLTTKIKLKFATADYTRQKGLNQTKATSDKIFQQTESEFNNQNVLLRSLAEKLRLIGINPSTLSENNISRNIKVYAPISGYVTKVNINAGKYVNATDVLFELISPGALHASLTVFERDAADLKIGQEIICTTSANPDKKYIAKIHLITPNIEGDRSTSVHCDIENADSKLIPGTFLNAAISVSNSIVAAIPEDAIVKWENKNYVFEDLGSNRYKMIPVETGASLDGFTEIKNKLKPANIVVRNAYAVLMKMKNGGEEG